MTFVRYFIFIQALFFSFLSNAQLNTTATAGQLENDARIELKKIHFLLNAHLNDSGEYPTDFSVIQYNLPSFLSKHFAISSNLQTQNFTVTFTGIASPMWRVFSINQVGVLTGMTQFAAAHELIQEIKQLLSIFYMAQKSYYVEYAEYSTDLVKLGMTVPPYLNRFGAIQISTSGSTFKVEFRGKIFPLQNRVFSIDENKILTGF